MRGSFFMISGAAAVLTVEHLAAELLGFHSVGLSKLLSLPFKLLHPSQAKMLTHCPTHTHAQSRLLLLLLFFARSFQLDGRP